MNVVKLGCPSCGASLELPSNLNVAHCLYCGTKISLNQDNVANEQRDLSRYIELCKVAVEAKNHAEVIEYCNRILGLDPNNIEAWMNKAVSTFFLTTTAHNRYDEAMEYLNRAMQIAPADMRIGKTRNELTRQQGWWLNNLGEQAWAASGRLWKSIADSGVGLYALKVADENSRPHYVRAMDYFLSASSYSPENIRILENIAGLVKDANWIQWSEKVYAKIKMLELLRSKKDAMDRLPKLNEELQKAQRDLALLRTQSGIFLGGKIKNAEHQISRLKADIAKLEKDASYDPAKK